MSIWKKYSFAWLTGILFLLSLIGQWYFGWLAYVNDQQEHQAVIQVSDYLVQIIRDTLENWQSEFLQLIWQVAGLAFLYFVGSPQSKESSDRQEEKIDEILRLLNQRESEKIIKDLDIRHSRK